MEESGIQILNQDNLISTIKTCYEKPFYRVLLVVPKYVMSVEVGSFVIDNISTLYPHEHSEFKIKLDTFRFPNGSLIKIINQGSTAKAYRVHKILLCDMSDLELIDVLNPMVRDYEEEQRMI